MSYDHIKARENGAKPAAYFVREEARQYGNSVRIVNKGETKRERMATRLMAGLLSNERLCSDPQHELEELADQAVKAADLLLIALEKT